MVRVLVAACVVLTVVLASAGTARADRQCRFEPAADADGTICTGALDDGPTCRGPGPGQPLPPAVLLVADKPSLSAPSSPPLAGPSVSLILFGRGPLGVARPGFPPALDRPPKSFSV